jgi:Fe-S oxidoreductase
MSLEEYKPMMERCSNCLGCKWSPFDKVKSLRFGENCPSISYNNFNTYAARGRFQLALGLINKEYPMTDTIVDVIHTCTSCGSCDITCKITRYNLEPLDHNIELKAEAVRQGKTLPAQKKMMEQLAKEKTMIPGKVNADRGKWLKDTKVKDVLKEKVQVLFFPGCKFSYDDAPGKSALSALKILLKSGVDAGVMGSADMCCAGRAYQMGFQDDFVKNAEANIKAFAKADVKTIVTPCSDCYHTFKRQYAKLGMKIEVLHTVEYLDRLIQEGKLKFTKSIPMTVTYHDPCHLGRLGEPYVPWEGKEKKILKQVHTWEPKRPRYNGAYGIYEPPRNILRAIPGINLVEMERIREYTWCCGAGGGCSETYPEFSNWTAGERISEANATGAEALVTACPWCESNFHGAVDENGKKIKVLDIVELIEWAL